MSTAIAGVSPHKEAVLMTLWPSIAATALGRMIGSLCGCIPLKINGIPISALIFGLPVAPLAALLYLGGKVAGEKYKLTRNSIQKWAASGEKMLKSVPLTDIAEIRVTQRSGQNFHKAADIILIGADGGILLKMEGMAYPESVRHNIDETRDAALQTASSLETIKKRTT